MTHERQNIRVGSFVGGLLCLAYAAYVMVTGTFLIHEAYPSIFLHRQADPLGYYFNLAGAILLGMVILYRSLLFIPANKKYWDEHPEYLRGRVEYQREQSKVNPVRLLKVTLVILLIFLVVMLVSKIL